MNPERKKILWLVSWYPNKWDAFDGDFIQRHAKAASVHHDIYVLFVKQAVGQPKKEQAQQTWDGLTEDIIYLPKRKGVFGKLQNHRQWLRVYKSEVARLIERDRPALVHVHVPWKVGLVALWARRTHHLPYIVTEHWGIYNKVVDDNISTKPRWVKSLFKKTFGHAQAFVSVSDYLGKGVNDLLLHKPYTVIPNVVDGAVFHPEPLPSDFFTFLHVSNMVPLKNVEGILQAFAAFLQTGRQAKLVMVGNRDEKYVRMADDLHLTPSIRFCGEIAYAAVATEMRRSQVLLLNSHIENSPCVIGEALCCGRPVIATAVGGVPELVNASNGILVPPRSTSNLVEAMIRLFDNYARFDLGGIANAAQLKFGIPSIAAQFSQLYQGFH